MKKKTGLISLASTLVVGIAIVMFLIFSTKITADIPSASSYAPTFKDWTIYFSEPMDPDSFSEGTVEVTNDEGDMIPVSLDWNDTYTNLTLLAPENGYTLNQEYKITVSNKVQTSSGQKLSQTFSHQFTAVEELPNIKDKEQLITLLKERIKKKEDNRLFSFGNSDDMAVEESADMAQDDASDSSGIANTSETNVQVSGIDEGDIVKQDGEFVYFVRDQDIIISSLDKENSEVLSQISTKNFYPREIYIKEDVLVTIGYSHEPIRDIQKNTQSDQSMNDIAILPMYHNHTTVHMYDISNKKSPKHIREVSFEGSYSSSRQMGDYLYLVANEHPPYQILEDETLEVRPFVKDTAVSEKGMPVDFEDMYFFPESHDETFMLLTSINLTDVEEQANVETYLGASNQIYMSHEHLYVAVNQYKEQAAPSSDGNAELMIWRPQSADTKINQFKIDDGRITYTASTTVNGTLINQFAMDERNETFRVATTKGNAWNEDEPSTNNLYTFDSHLNPLGSVEGLAEGERIYSVRFMDEIAYMVTFKEVDPLFVIDLQNPNQPTVLGELKIPGFSNYLHPIDEDHVIGFGQNTKLEDNPHSDDPIVRMDGIKISLFDVSDLSNPIEKYSEVIGQGGSYTELNHNHKALYKHPTENLFGFPATLFETKMVQRGDITYEEQQYLFEGALLYDISPETGIQLRDTITHQKEIKEYPEWESEIRRLISVDNTLYSLSIDQLSVYDLENETTIQTVPLPKIQY